VIETEGQQARGRRASDGTSRQRRQLRHAPELGHLTLQQLRDHRQELVTEEIRVSYWRRILQARMDLIIGNDDHTALQRLGGVLAEHEAYSRRLAVQSLHVPDDAPPLPDLGMLWDTSMLNDDSTTIVARLAEAEHQLSAYRRSLHERLDAATGELIARYHDDPSLALSALPLRPQHGRGLG
jgi:anti-sigma-K factor RsiG